MLESARPPRDRVPLHIGHETNHLHLVLLSRVHGPATRLFAGPARGLPNQVSGMMWNDPGSSIQDETKNMLLTI